MYNSDKYINKTNKAL